VKDEKERPYENDVLRKLQTLRDRRRFVKRETVLLFDVKKCSDAGKQVLL